MTTNNMADEKHKQYPQTFYTTNGFLCCWVFTCIAMRYLLYVKSQLTFN